MDSFSWITMVIAFLLCFVAPPLGLLLAFGPGKTFRNDLLLYLSGLFFLIGVLIYVVGIGGIVGATPFWLIVLLGAGIALWAAAFFYAVLTLIKALRVKRTD